MLTKKTARLLEIIAWVLAGVILAIALVYYNFIDKAPESGIETGNRCPDFMVQTYTEKDGVFAFDGEDFVLSRQVGKVCVINFWETWCTACIEELPEFDEIKEEYGDEVEVLAIVGTTSTPEYAMSWMNKKGWETVSKAKDWADFSLTVGYMPAKDAEVLGVTSMLPRTVIVDKSGIVVHTQNGAMSKADLQAIIDPLL
jgi:thiol-disulfide isomerase/thioredoxin